MPGLSKLAAILRVGLGLVTLLQNPACGASDIKPELAPVPVQRVAGLKHPFSRVVCLADSSMPEN